MVPLHGTARINTRLVTGSFFILMSTAAGSPQCRWDSWLIIIAAPGATSMPHETQKQWWISFQRSFHQQLTRGTTEPQCGLVGGHF